MDFEVINEIFRIGANYIAAAGAIPIALFIIYYGTKAIPGHRWKRQLTNRWKKTGIGRTLMYQKAAMLGLLVMVVVNLFTNEYFFQDQIRFIVYTILFTLFWRMFFQLRKQQKIQDNEDEPYL